MFELKDYGNYVDRKAKLNKYLLFLGMLPLIPATILFFMNMFAPSYEAANPWYSHMMLYVFVPIIFFQLFAIQKRELVGSYGETILLLIPTFIWLLPGHSAALIVIRQVSFLIIIIGSVLYTFSMLLRYVRDRVENRYKNKKKIISIKYWGYILLKLAFVLSSVVSTLTISILLINYADFSLDLAGTSDPKVKDYTSSLFIVFISVVTILVAVFLVTLGLLDKFKINIAKSKTSKAEREFNLTHSFTVTSSMSDLFKTKDTQNIKTEARKKKKKRKK